MQKIRQKPEERVWNDFATDEKLTPEQLEKFTTYAHLLLEWNEKSNLTAIKDLSGIVNQHFIDSMQLSKNLTSRPFQAFAILGLAVDFQEFLLKSCTLT